MTFVKEYEELRTKSERSEFQKSNEFYIQTMAYNKEYAI